MSNETSNELVVNPAPHVHGTMTKNRMMQYTFFAILATIVVSAALWSQVTTPSGWNLGLTVAICALISVGIAVVVDFLIGKVASDSEVNTWSAAVFGLIVTGCYQSRFPRNGNGTEIGVPVEAPLAFYYVALISVIGMVVFKKVMGLAGRKLVNPAAAAKFLVLLPSTIATLLTSWHLKNWNATSSITSRTNQRSNRLLAATAAQQAISIRWLPTKLLCITHWQRRHNAQHRITYDASQKFHGWVGGASSIAVIIAGIALFAIGRKYFKWKITASYLIAIAVLSLIFSFAFGDADLTTRLLFELFVGSSIFMAFFMATDPATTPFSGIGQIIFGVGLAVLTIVIQTFMGFFGGSLLALLIMNLTVPLIDKIRINKPFGR